MSIAGIKIGYCPTRRFVFSKEDAHFYKEETLNKIKSFGFEVVDLEGINEEGLLYDNYTDIQKVVKRFKENEVDAIFIPHCNFGTENSVSEVARAIGKPTLLWGPRDEMPLPDGSRLRDSQCGLFATGKVLRRFNVPYSYIPNCRLGDEVFERGFKNFVAAANVVKAFNNIKILQIGPRPAGFWSVIVNEGELLEKFGIKLFPISIKDIEIATLEIEKNNSKQMNETILALKSIMDCRGATENQIKRIAALKIAIQNIVEDEKCTGVAIQCWTSLQDSLGIMPCMSMGLLAEIGIPVGCETDIHGTISMILAQAALFGENVPFLADVTVRHPENDNAELLFHCGPMAPSLVKKGKIPALEHHHILPSNCCGTCDFEIEGGDITIIRFDGDHGEYELFVGEAKGIEGPFIKGNYLWFEVDNWLKWEEILVTGPFIHHVAGIHGKIAPILYEACKYIPSLKPRHASPSEDIIRDWLRGQ